MSKKYFSWNARQPLSPWKNFLSFYWQETSGTVYWVIWWPKSIRKSWRATSGNARSAKRSTRAKPWSEIMLRLYFLILLYHWPSFTPGAAFQKHRLLLWPLWESLQDKRFIQEACCCTQKEPRVLWSGSIQFFERQRKRIYSWSGGFDWRPSKSRGVGPSWQCFGFRSLSLFPR